MKKIIIASILSLLMGISLTGCFDPVFNNILQDVPPENATVNGVITSIARYTVSGQEYLVLAANNGLRYKNASDESHVTWKTAKIPFDLHRYDYFGSNPNGGTGVHKGQQIIKVVADSTSLYLVTASYENDYSSGRVNPSKIHIWKANISDWADISWDEVNCDIRPTANPEDDPSLFQIYEKNDEAHTRFNVFSTNSIKAANRHVYIRSGSSTDTLYYELSNGSLSTISPKLYNGNDSNNLNGVAVLGSTPVFFESNAVCSNETSSSDSTVIYFGKPKSEKLFYYKGGTSEGEETVACGEELACIAVTGDSIIVGRADTSTSGLSKGGVVHLGYNSSTGVPNTTLSSFETNASTQLSYSYQILTLLVTDPKKDEVDATIYSSITFRGSGTSTSVSYDNIGLWSYYPLRGNWNRE